MGDRDDVTPFRNLTVTGPTSLPDYFKSPVGGPPTMIEPCRGLGDRAADRTVHVGDEIRVIPGPGSSGLLGLEPPRRGPGPLDRDS